MTQLIRDFDFSVLSAAERIALAEQLLDSVQGQAEAPRLTIEQQAEIQRRMDAVDNGTMPLVAWEEVKHEMLRGR
jgi:putative addiction module component (TIGR02574 family)